MVRNGRADDKGKVLGDLESGRVILKRLCDHIDLDADAKAAAILRHVGRKVKRVA